MQLYIALLRGINVGGHKKILMADLRATIERLGFKNVRTYIQSGNLIFESELETISIIEDAIKNAILIDFGFDVPILVKSNSELKTVVKANPIDLSFIEKSYFTLLASPPSKDKLKSFNALEWDNETVFCDDTCVYFYSDKPYNKVKCSGNFIEKYFRVKTTTRNFKTMQALLKMVQTN